MKMPHWIRRVLLWLLRNAPELLGPALEAKLPQEWVTLAFFVDMDVFGAMAGTAKLRAYHLMLFESEPVARQYLARSSRKELERFAGAFREVPGFGAELALELEAPEVPPGPRGDAWTINGGFRDLTELLDPVPPAELRKLAELIRATREPLALQVARWVNGYAELLEELEQRTKPPEAEEEEI